MTELPTCDADIMLQHLRMLYDWTITDYPHSRFELRCIPDGGKPYSKCFDCTEAGYQQAIVTASQLNEQQFNAYVTANPLKPGTDHPATDDDVEIAVYHFADADGTDLDQINQRCNGYHAAFAVLTGTIPTPRQHINWRMDQPIRDMQQWHDTQDGVAFHLQTDASVKNPARIVRLAGSVSYPPARKQAKGYVIELTDLITSNGDQVNHEAFAESFAKPPQKPLQAAAMPAPPPGDNNAKVPLHVVEAALAAIPPVMQAGDQPRNLWLDISQACRDAHPDAWHLFDAWQRQSPRYDPADSKGWPDKRTPSQHSWKSLLKHAKANDANWWRFSDEAELWMLRQAAHQVTDEAEVHEAPDERGSAPAKPMFFGIRLRDLDLRPPPREFIYGKSLIRGMLSVFGGPGGSGKTSIVLTKLISIIIGRPLLGLDHTDRDHHIYEPHGVCMYYSLEDPMDDLVRRVNGILQHYDIPHRAVWDKLILQSGRDLPLSIARNHKGVMTREATEPITDYLKANNVVVLGIDPYTNSFDGGDGGESSSDVQKIVMDQWRKIVHDAHLAGWLIHHFKKGGLAGDADAFRGSSVLQNAARCMETLTTMTKEDADTLGIGDYERRSYLRLENAKVNLSAAPTDGEWYRMIGVPLGNRTEKYPDGDCTGVPVRWTPVLPEVPWSQIETTLKAIEAGCDDGKEFYSSQPRSSRYAADLIASTTCLNRRQAVAKMTEWLADGVLARDSYRSPKTRKEAERLVINQTAMGRLKG